MSEILRKSIDSVLLSNKSFCRFITANDTGINGSHQSGFYIPKCAATLLFTEPCAKGENLDKSVKIKWQDDFITDSRFIYYGKGTRNEFRITRFGKFFPFLEEENVGNLLIISQIDEENYEAFVLSSDNDIDSFLAYFELSPNSINNLISKPVTLDTLLLNKINDFLLNQTDFPDTVQMSTIARNIYNESFNITLNLITEYPDALLLNWIDTEYCLFRNLEEKIYKPTYTSPFNDCQELINFANTILNRRKSRAGKSLEHHLSSLFTSSQLKFEEQVITEDNKKPDFLFPDGASYHNFDFPADKLVFLGAKTTCKDRWRQVLNEANRIETKYLFTLQQGISKNQLEEMKHENLKLVVPSSYITSFDKDYRSEILSLSSFISMVKYLQE